VPGAAAGVAFPVEQRALGGRLAQGVFQALALFAVEGVEQPGGGGQQMLLLEAEQFLAAFADEQEAEFALGIAPQVEQHAGQVGGQRVEAGLAFVEHFQRGAVVGAMARFAHFALDAGIKRSSRSASITSRAPAFMARCSERFVRRAGDQDQRQVEAASSIWRRHSAAKARKPPGKIEHGVPRLVGKRGAQGGSCLCDGIRTLSASVEFRPSLPSTGRSRSIGSAPDAATTSRCRAWREGELVRPWATDRIQEWRTRSV
jgi:hypothetical protein